MKLLRTAAIGVACILGPAMGEAIAHPGNGHTAWMPHHQYGYPAMMGHCPGGMGGYGHGMPGHGYGHGHGHGSMMTPGGYGGHGGPGSMGMHGRYRVDADKLDDEALDRIGERIAERHRRMQEIAGEQDPAARREMVRKHLQSRRAYQGSDNRGPGEPGQHAHQRGLRNGGMGTPGMMGPGAGMMGSGAGMMGSGAGMMGMMAPGMMRGGAMAGEELGDEQLDRMAEHMIGQHARMQQLAETEDPAARRELLREHFQSMREFMAGMHRYQ